MVTVTRAIEGRRLRTRARLTAAGAEALGALWGTLDTARAVGAQDTTGDDAREG